MLDASGKLLKSTPPVQLRLISGPGEFPTGSSILFEKDSDIRIMDGQAAIAFRSYYAGKSVIEATSPGLKPARIEITFEGNDIWKEGITPRVKERPYTQYIREKQEKSIQTFGRKNPTFASSYHEGQAVGLAADGNPATFWQAAEKDTAPYWILDTEKSLTLHEIQIVFPSSAVYCYTVDISDDKQQWLTVSDTTIGFV